MRTGMLYKAAKTSYHFLRDDVLFSYLLYPYGKYKFNTNSVNKRKSQSHTYTSFYRSPLQLKVLTKQIKQSSLDNLEIAVFAGSNGSEAYTIASHLSMSLPDLKFRIISSDLHPENIDMAEKAIYQKQHLRFIDDIPIQFIQHTFDQKGDILQVKDHIKNKVTFCVADLLDPKINEQFSCYDIVFLQNVLFHLDNSDAINTFKKIIKLVKPGGLFFIDGMNLDMREDLTEQFQLIPVTDYLEEIYNYSRKHIPRDWWNYYYGCEPINIFNKKRVHRYCTIFKKPQVQL
jgi:chemotaxis methyl-accepting protein methylase